jgi:hypothetical protein
MTVFGEDLQTTGLSAYKSAVNFTKLKNLKIDYSGLDSYLPDRRYKSSLLS